MIESVSAIADGTYPHVVSRLKAHHGRGFLKSSLGCDSTFACISAIDWPAKNSIEVVYD
jgi:hypothetical protein